jgi:hypothetical protein
MELMRAKRKRIRSIANHGGYSLLEVVLATGICTTALVTALSLMRTGMVNSGTIDTRHLMVVFGVSKMEEQLAVVAASWSTGTIGGDFSADGHPDIRYTVTRSDAPASGGLTNRLMNVTLTVYSDANGNDAMDASEMRSVFTTKIGNSINYQGIAGS